MPTTYFVKNVKQNLHFVCYNFHSQKWFKKKDFTNDCQYANPFSSPIQTKIKLQISSYPKMVFFNNSNSQLPPF